MPHPPPPPCLALLLPLLCLCFVKHAELKTDKGGGGRVLGEGRLSRPTSLAANERHAGSRSPGPPAARPMPDRDAKARSRTHHGLLAPGCHPRRRLRSGNPAALPLSA